MYQMSGCMYRSHLISIFVRLSETTFELMREKAWGLCHARFDCLQVFKYPDWSLIDRETR